MHSTDDDSASQESPAPVETVDEVFCQAPADPVSSAAIGTFDLGLESWGTFNAIGAIPELLSDGEHTDNSMALNLDTSSSPSDLFSLALGTSPLSFDTMSRASSSSDSFADSYHLPVHELTLLKAFMRISQRIGCQGQLWSLDAVSPFHSGAATPSDQLPASWRPTPSQVLVKHHPILDFMPWPSVREKVIGLFSLPDEMRPPHASGQLALVNFAYDFEDNAEGVRIYGDDPYDAGSWEVGQVFFERWWFLFDRDIIENSNRWRRLRGAAPLAIKGN